MTGALGLAMNAVLIVLLGATIVYAMRLSRHISTLKNSRKDFERLLADLGGEIDKAGKAVAALKQTARDSGRALQGCIDEARTLRDELQIIVESGNSLAGRIEKAADRKAAPPPAARRTPPPEPVPVEAKFAIRDIEFDRGEDDQGLDAEAMKGEGLQSRAERELMAALRQRGRTEGGK